MVTSQLSMFSLFENNQSSTASEGTFFEPSQQTSDDIFRMFSTNPSTVDVSDLFANIETKEDEHVQVADVRTEKQKNHKVSYDVGEKIWGARKDLEEFKRLFLEKPDTEVLNQIAELDVVVADDLANKANVFSWFSMEDCSQRGVNIHAAYGMNLLIRRIPTNSKGLVRNEYMDALIFVSDNLKEVRTIKEFSDTFHRFGTLVKCDSEKDFRERQLVRVRKMMDELLADEESFNESVMNDLQERGKIALGMLFLNEQNVNYNLDILGNFSELLTSSKKLKTFNKSLNKYTTWKQYFEENGSKTVQTGVERKPVWERELPVEPKRVGGREFEDIQTPEQFKLQFGFKGIQFGNYVKDDYGLAHIVNSSRALVDLSDILQIDEQGVSLGYELSLALGARGKGKALGHYERGYHIINMTKEKGSLGILAHEWFHAYDRFLKMTLADNSDGLLTEGEQAYLLPTDVLDRYANLMHVIKNGKSTAYVDVSNCNGTYSLRSRFTDLYHELDGDLQKFMDTKMEQFDDRMAQTLSGYVDSSYYERSKAKFERKRKIELRQNAEALSQYHEKVTGKKVYFIPYTVNQSRFYRNAIDLDRGREGKYWSSNQELCARVFEAYIAQQLEQRNWRSDYLVYGIDAFAYPAGNEQDKILNAMSEFLEVTLPHLRGKHL